MSSFIKDQIEKLVLSETEQDTVDLQLDCLEEFLLEIGYTYTIAKDLNFHIKNFRQGNNPKYMSLEKAVQLYNGSYFTWRNLRRDTTSIGYFTFDNKSLDEANKNKYIRKVKLQRKNGVIGVSGNMVSVISKREI